METDKCAQIRLLQHIIEKLEMTPTLNTEEELIKFYYIQKNDVVCSHLRYLYDMRKCSPCNVKFKKWIHNSIYCTTAILLNMCTSNEKGTGETICYPQGLDS